MKIPPPFTFAFWFLSAPGLRVAGPFGNRDTPDLHDEREGRYSIPYHQPKTEEIAAVVPFVPAAR